MEQDKPTKLDDNIVPYLKFFLLFHITYFISSITISILNSVSPNFFSFFNRFFDSLVLPIFNALFILITLKIILTYFPDFSNQKTIPFYIPIIAFVISSHPIDIYIDGDTFKVNYFTMDYFNYPLFNPYSARTHSGKNGGHELELISFLFTATARCTSLFNHCSIYKKNPTPMGTALPDLPYSNWIWCPRFSS